MAADFKSHVLRRDEKGLLGVPFKRLLLGGVCGGLGYLLSGLLLGAGGIPVGIVVGVTAIILTGTRGGLPLWLRLVCRGCGALLLAAARDRHGLAAQVVRWLSWSADAVYLDGAQVYAPPAAETGLDLREWVTFARADERDGLVFVDAPTAEVT